MSVFNPTYENLLEDREVVLESFDQTVYYMKKLTEYEIEFRVRYVLNWWANKWEFVIQLD